jgi:hypothetical protein
MNETNKKLWFRAKRYGWGWMPVSWEGWLVTLAYTALMVTYAVLISNNIQAHKGFNWLDGIGVVVYTYLLILICYKKGEKPRWQWGKPTTNKDN